LGRRRGRAGSWLFLVRGRLAGSEPQRRPWCSDIAATKGEGVAALGQSLRTGDRAEPWCSRYGLSVLEILDEPCVLRSDCVRESAWVLIPTLRRHTYALPAVSTCYVCCVIVQQRRQQQQQQLGEHDSGKGQSANAVARSLGGSRGHAASVGARWLARGDETATATATGQACWLRDRRAGASIDESSCRGKLYAYLQLPLP
jgi:hypothetical protein